MEYAGDEADAVFIGGAPAFDACSDDGSAPFDARLDGSLPAPAEVVDYMSDPEILREYEQPADMPDPRFFLTETEEETLLQKAAPFVGQVQRRLETVTVPENGRVILDMNESVAVDVGSDEQAYILTGHLNGCTVGSAIVRMEDGSVASYVSHFGVSTDDTLRDTEGSCLSVSVMSQFLNRLRRGGLNIQDMRIVVAYGEEYDDDSYTPSEQVFSLQDIRRAATTLEAETGIGTAFVQYPCDFRMHTFAVGIDGDRAAAYFDGLPVTDEI